jgi:hypothetical protein
MRRDNRRDRRVDVGSAGIGRAIKVVLPPSSSFLAVSVDVGMCSIDRTSRTMYDDDPSPTSSLAQDNHIAIQPYKEAATYLL